MQEQDDARWGQAGEPGSRRCSQEWVQAAQWQAAVLLSLPSITGCWHSNMTEHISLSGCAFIGHGLHWGLLWWPLNRYSVLQQLSRQIPSAKLNRTGPALLEPRGCCISAGNWHQLQSNALEITPSVQEAVGPLLQ